jgi:hypothetical protein
MKPTTRQMKAIDKQIEAIFYAKCSGVVIPIMRISEIWKAGQLAAAQGLDIEAAVVDCTLRIAADLAVPAVQS